MNDSSPFPPSPETPRPGSLPAPRGSAGPRSKAEDSGEQVSLDEMMERLRRSGESGSGSGRRRRRSSQDGGGSSSRSSRSSGGGSSGQRRLPNISFEDAPMVREPGSRKRLWIGAGILGLLLAAGGIYAGIGVLNRVRVEGDGFKVNVARRVTELLGRRVNFERFREAEKYSIGNSTMVITPDIGDLLDSAQVNDLMVQLTPGSWVSDDWILASVRAREIKLAFQPGKVLDNNTFTKIGMVPVNRGAAPKGGFRIGVTSDPASIALETAQFESLNLSWPGPGGKVDTISKMEGNLRIADGGVNLEARGGVLDTAAWPAFPIQQVNARLKGTTLDIISARLALSETSSARLSGKAELVSDGTLELTAEISPVQLKDILPESWNSRVAGQFSTSGAKWKSQFKSGPPAEFSGPFKGHGMVLKELGFVDKIANILRKPDLTLMEFIDFRGDFFWTAARVRLENLQAQSQDNFLKLSGWVEVVPGESIAGKLRLEASEIFFAGRTDGIPQGFVPSGEGFYALDFELTGRGNVVQDSIPVPVPVMMDKGPDLPPVKLKLPPGVGPRTPAAPTPAAPAQTQTPAPSSGSSLEPKFNMPSSIEVDSIAPSSVPARKKTTAEMEKEFNELIGR